jgi:CubicO group peptidase (beta-lactamase class C family)
MPICHAAEAGRVNAELGHQHGIPKRHMPSFHGSGHTLTGPGFEAADRRQIDAALARPIGSAVALSIGDAGIEIERIVRGYTRRVPDLGEAIADTHWFDVASLTKPMVTVACAMVLVAERRLDLESPITRWIANATSRRSRAAHRRPTQPACKLSARASR